MGSKASQNEMTPSQLLSKERLARGWSVKEVAQQLGASEAVVQQLESDEPGNLAGVYRDAYLKRYLSLMGFTEIEVMESDTPQLQVVLPMPKRRRWLEKTLGWARYALASLIVFPPLVWVSVNHSTSWITGGLMGLGEIPPIQTSAPNVRQLQASQIPVRALKGDGVGDFGQDNLASADAVGLEFSRRAPSAPLPNVLKVRMLEDSWLELTDSQGQRLEQNVLRADAEYSYLGEPPFSVLVGLGSAVEFELDGHIIEHLDSDQAKGLMEFEITTNGEVTPKP